MLAVLALISGMAVINVLIYLIVFGLIFWVLWWGLQQVALPEPFDKVARVVLVVAAMIVVINGLLMLVGSPFITW